MSSVSLIGRPRLSPRRADHRLIYAAKTDSEEMLLEVLNGSEPFDVNYQDGLGQTGESLPDVEWGPTASTAKRRAAS